MNNERDYCAAGKADAIREAKITGLGKFGFTREQSLLIIDLDAHFKTQLQELLVRSVSIIPETADTNIRIVVSSLYARSMKRTAEEVVSTLTEVSAELARRFSDGDS